MNDGNEIQLGRLTSVDPRKVWPHEAFNFTPWLARPENISLLGDTIRIQLAVLAQEKYVGPFRADILCRDEFRNNYVLIENQLEGSDHGHLGQLITYAAGLEAVSIVWIARSFTDEHRAALDWLNNTTGEGFNFFGLELELWQIGNSLMAPKFNVVSEPNNWIKTGRGGTEHLEFWTQFQKYLQDHAISIHMGQPSKGALINVILGPSLFRIIPWRLLRDNRIGVWVRFNEPISYDSVEQGFRQRVEDQLRPLGTVEWLPKTERREATIELGRASTPLNPDTLDELNQWLALAIGTTRTLFSDITNTLNGNAPLSGSPSVDAALAPSWGGGSG